jgi:ABC-type Fe3+-hydroxamate transport system substrate-binding protein
LTQTSSAHVAGDASPRVVSLVPSITETLLAWRVHVVACTRFCEQPSLPHVGGTKDPDIAAIVQLAPDVVVVDREENRREDAEALVAAGVAVHVTHVVHIDDVAPMLRELAEVVRADPTAIASADHEAADRSVESTGGAGGSPSAFVPIWRRPTMSINGATYASTVLARLGVRNVLADHADVYPTVDLVEVAALQPDLVLLPSEPYPFAPRHVAEYQRAVPGSRVLLIDGQDLFWWGVRTAPALQRLRAALRGPTPPS